MIMRVTVNLRSSKYGGRGGTLLAFVTRIQLEGPPKKKPNPVVSNEAHCNYHDMKGSVTSMRGVSINIVHVLIIRTDTICSTWMLNARRNALLLGLYNKAVLLGQYMKLWNGRLANRSSITGRDIMCLEN